MLRDPKYAFAALLLTLAACGDDESVTTGEDTSSEESRVANEYLDANLRERVESLQTKAASEKTNAANVRERSRLLLDWSNARARAGRFIPHDVTMAASVFLTVPASDMKELAGFSFKTLDNYIKEMTLLDEQPDSLGLLSVDKTGPFVADRFATLKFTYTLGSLAIQKGGGFFLANHPGADLVPFQTNDPSAPSYVSIRSTNKNVKFTSAKRAVPGAFGGLFDKSGALFFRLSTGTLKEGDQVVITYGDKSKGSPGLKMPTYSNERTPFGIFIDPDGSGQNLSLPLQPIRVIGAQVAGVKGFAPSIVKTGETVEISVRSEDIWRNRASGNIPAYEVLVNGRHIHTIKAGKSAITVLKGLKFSRPGVYRFSFRSTDGAIVGDTNPILVEANPKTRVYWGETHGHTGYAEGIGTAEGYMAFAKTDARLDFVMHSEHDLMMDDGEWAEMLRVAQQYHKEGSFLAFAGYEWTVDTARGGHHNVMYRTAEGRMPTKAVDAPVLSMLYQGLRAQNNPKDVLVIPHAHRAADWRVSDPNIEHLIEIMSMHGNFEWFGRMYLANGHQVGFLAGSDDHKSHPGYANPTASGLQQPGGLAAVRAPEKTSNALFDAMKARSVYATTGERIILDVSVNGTPMGKRTRFTNRREISGRVIGTAPIDTITLVKNGQEIITKDVIADSTGKSSRLQLMFNSPSNPPGFIRDNPRGWRPWIGTIKVEGARLVSASMPSLRNHRTEKVEIDAENSNLVHFSTYTRGGYRSYELELAEITAGARIIVTLEPTQERPTAPSPYRERAKLAGATLTFALSGLTGEGRSQKLALDTTNAPLNAGYEDVVRLRRINETPALETPFQFIEEDAYQPGDNYYVRVIQSDGATAWSSPVWVGGDRPR